MKETKKHKIMLIVGIVFITILASIIIILINKNNQIKVNIYTIDGESENFYYVNAMFVSSKIKNIYVYGDIESKNSKINIKDITNVELKSGDRLIVASNSLPKQISIENYGYDELFPKEVVDNLDNWYLEITYKDGKETTTEKIKLNNRYVMDKVKVQPIA